MEDEDVGRDKFSDALGRLFTERSKTAMHNAKPVLRGLAERGVKIEGVGYDTAIAAYLLSSADSAYPLESVAQKYLGCAPDERPDEKNGQTSLFDSDGGDNGQKSAQKLCERAAAVYALRGATERILKKQGLFGLMRDVEMPLVTVLMRMELAGAPIDRDKLKEFGGALQDRLTRITARIYELAGGEFNINSTKALGDVLFEKLGLRHIKKTKTGYSTDIEVLKKLKNEHEIIPLIIEYRQISKLMSTYVDGLIKDISPVDGRIHTTFQQTVTATGRLSSTAPNLQNIPVRRELGAEIRRTFAAPEGYVLIDADYSQIELRILAHVSADNAMLEAFASGEDIHAATAAQVFGVPRELVTPKMRSAAKAVNFGIVYGISEFSLAEDIGVSRAEAREYIRSYLEKYGGIREYMDGIKQRAAADGYVTTLFGRRRYLPELKSSDHNVRAFGERVAMNMPIQGTAADIIKMAMIAVDRQLRENNMKTRLILQIHDELILEAPEDERERAERILREQMESVFDSKARLIAEVSSGKSWLDAK